MRLYDRASVPEDVEFLAPRLRPEDIDECWAAGHVFPEEALKTGLQVSEVCQTIVYAGDDEDIPVAIYGANPGDSHGDVAAVWMLASDDLYRAKKTFLRYCPRYVDSLNRRYPVLFNYVDARNARHIAWLKWTGFQFIKRHDEFGPERLPFYEFVRVR